MPDPERAPLVRRAFEEYATGRFTKEQLLKQTRAWGLTNRRGRPLTSQAIGTLLRNRLHAGIVDVPEYGVRAKRGDFELLISEAFFYRVPAVLSGLVPNTTPQQRAHPDFPLRAFVGCDQMRQAYDASPQVACRKSAARPGFQISLERDRSLLVGELHDDIDPPWSSTRRVKAATGIVRLEPGAPITGDAGVIPPRVSTTTEHVDAAPRHPHTLRDCTSDSGRIV